MKLQYLIVIFIIIMLPLVLILSQYVGIQVDTIGQKTRLDTSLLGATYDTIAAYELNTRNSSASDLIGEDIRDLEAVISTFTRSLSSSLGQTGVDKDYILSYIPAVAFCMYDGYYIYLPNEPAAGKEKLQPYVYYTKNYTNGDTDTDITIAYSLDNYVTIYGKKGTETFSAAGYLINPNDIDIKNFSYVTTTAEDGGMEYKVLSGNITYKGINITKEENLVENKPQKSEQITVEKKEKSTDAMMYYYQALKFTNFYNGIVGNLNESDRNKLVIGKDNDNDNDPDNEVSAFNDERVNVIKDALTSNLNRAIYNFEGVNQDTYEMPQLNGEDWDKILNNIAVVAFMKDMPLDNQTTYNNYVVVNSTVTHKYTSAKAIEFIGYDNSNNSKGYYHKLTCQDFLNDINSNQINKIIGYPAIDFERFKSSVDIGDDAEKDYYYYYKHNEYMDYDCIVKPKESINVSTLAEYLNDMSSISTPTKDIIKKAYYTAVGRIRFRQAKASSYININLNNTTSYDVLFYPGDGSWSDNSDYKKVNSNYGRVEILKEKPIYTGYEFYGYEAINNPTGEVARIGDILYAYPDLSLKAVYKEQYTIKYMYEDGRTFGVQTKLNGVDLEMLTTIPTEDNMQFSGWKVEGEDKVKYPIEDMSNWIITDDKNITLIAVFTEKKCKINYYDAKIDGKENPQETCNMGDNYTIKAPDNKTGYKFLRWETYNGAVEYQPGTQIGPIQNDIKLYAKWETIIYTIHFNYDGGKAVNQNANNKVEISVKAMVELTAPEIEKENLTLKGWYTYKNKINEAGERISEVWDKEGLGYTFITEDFIEKYYFVEKEVNGVKIMELDVYPVWTDNYWNITYKSDGIEDIKDIGVYNQGKLKYEMTTLSEKALSEKAVPKKAVSEKAVSHKLTGWKANDGTIYEPGETRYFDQRPNDMTLEAIWKPTKITITYKYDGKTIETKTLTENQLESDYRLPNEDYLIEKNKANLKIKKWKNTGGGKPYEIEPNQWLEKQYLTKDYTFEAQTIDDTPEYVYVPPIMAKGSEWYKSSVSKSTIEKIELIDKGIPYGTIVDEFDCSENNDGSVKGYIVGTTLYIVGNGNGEIIANKEAGSMFSYFTQLKEITNLKLLDTSSVLNMDCMFLRCYSLKSLDVSGFDTSSVLNMDGMFYECQVLNELDLRSFDTSNVTNMSDMFYNCSSLTSLDLSNFNTINVTDMSCMFYMCSALTGLNLSNFNTGKVVWMGGMFCYCSSLTYLNISNFNTDHVIRMDGMFAYCSALTSLDVSSFNTSRVVTMSSMFSECNSLYSLNVRNFDTSNVEQMSYMFEHCYDVRIYGVLGFNMSKVKGRICMTEGCKYLYY